MPKTPDLFAAHRPLRAVLVDVPSGRELSPVVEVLGRGSATLRPTAPSGHARVLVHAANGTLVAWVDVESEVIVDNTVTVDLSRVTVTDA